jgi:hypothetical protein
MIVNVTGEEPTPVRWLAAELGARLGREPMFGSAEAADALLSDTARYRELLGGADMPLSTMLDWAAEWVRAGRPLLGKPTHFETRDGAF